MTKILLIDTSSNKEIKVGIRINGKEYIIKRKIGKNKAQVALPMIDKLLKQQGIALKDLKSIEVNTSHGSFTGIRVGMAIANALAFALKIPAKPRLTQ
jgi:tRNA threonylcarbamoyladenosine biosynthesis protein TsaB